MCAGRFGRFKFGLVGGLRSPDGFPQAQRREEFKEGASYLRVRLGGKNLCLIFADPIGAFPCASHPSISAGRPMDWKSGSETTALSPVVGTALEDTLRGGANKEHPESKLMA